MDADAILSRLDPRVGEIGGGLRSRLRAWLPDAEEQPDAAANVIGYGYGPGYKGLVCTMILSRNGVKLGIYRGAELPDPAGLLGGKGKVHRSVEIADRDRIDDPGLSRLVAAARAATLARLGQS